MFPVINRVETGLNLRRLMERRSISAKDVQRYLGLGCVQSVYRWLDGSSMPTIDNLYALSSLFQVPIDEIVCGNRTALKRNLSVRNRSRYENRVCAYYIALHRRYIA